MKSWLYEHLFATWLSPINASLAYAIVQKQVILSYADSPGKKLIDTTDYAWATIYRKKVGEWKAECNVSTNK